MNKASLEKKFIEDLNNYIKSNKNIINAVKSLELISYFTGQANSIFDYVYKWHSLEYPELYAQLSKNNKAYIKAILDLDLEKKESVITESLGNESNLIIKQLCTLFMDMDKVVEKLKSNIDKSAKQSYPNLAALLGPILATKFISQMGSLERLAKLPSSTLQLVGAETALFKHLKYGKKCPKYGFIYQHPIMQGIDNKRKGKLARFFAGKIELAIRADVYTKKDMGAELLKSLDEKKAEIKAQK